MTESLRAIKIEFEAADTVIGRLETNHQENVDQFTTLSRLLATGRIDLPADSVLRLSVPLWTFQNFTPTMPAYAEFLAGGGLTNLDQEYLSDALFTYELQLKANRDYDDYLRTSMMMSWEPILSSRIPFGDLAEDTPEALRLMTGLLLIQAPRGFRHDLRSVPEYSVAYARFLLVLGVLGLASFAAAAFAVGPPAGAYALGVTLMLTIAGLQFLRASTSFLLGRGSDTEG